MSDEELKKLHVLHKTGAISDQTLLERANENGDTFPDLQVITPPDTPEMKLLKTVVDTAGRMIDKQYEHRLGIDWSKDGHSHAVLSMWQRDRLVAQQQVIQNYPIPAHQMMSPIICMIPTKTSKDKIKEIRKQLQPLSDKLREGLKQQQEDQPEDDLHSDIKFLRDGVEKVLFGPPTSLRNLKHLDKIPPRPEFPVLHTHDYVDLPPDIIGRRRRFDTSPPRKEDPVRPTPARINLIPGYETIRLEAYAKECPAEPIVHLEVFVQDSIHLIVDRIINGFIKPCTLEFQNFDTLDVLELILCQLGSGCPVAEALVSALHVSPIIRKIRGEVPMGRNERITTKMGQKIARERKNREEEREEKRIADRAKLYEAKPCPKCNGYTGCMCPREEEADTIWTECKHPRLTLISIPVARELCPLYTFLDSDQVHACEECHDIVLLNGVPYGK